MSKIIVIGSGFGGLASAIRLAAKGHDVEVFEQRDKLGGRAYVYEKDGFVAAYRNVLAACLREVRSER